MLGSRDWAVLCSSARRFVCWIRWCYSWLSQAAPTALKILHLHPHPKAPNPALHYSVIPIYIHSPSLSLNPWESQTPGEKLSGSTLASPGRTTKAFPWFERGWHCVLSTAINTLNKIVERPPFIILNFEISLQPKENTLEWETGYPEKEMSAASSCSALLTLDRKSVV